MPQLNLTKKKHIKAAASSRHAAPLTLRNLYRRKVNQLVSIFSATDSVLKSTREKKQIGNVLVILVISKG